MALNFILFRFPGVPGVKCAFQILDSLASGMSSGMTAGMLSGIAAETDDNWNISLDVAKNHTQVTENRQQLLETLNLPAFAELKQVHGVKTIFEPEAQNISLPATQEADGLAISRSGLGLLIKTADCQPLLLAHKSGRHVLALHIGWKGNRQNFPQIAVREFCLRYGLSPADLLAVRGPSLGPAAAEFINFQAEWGTAFSPWLTKESNTINLWQLTKDQLLEADLKPNNIFSLDLCTYSLPEAFFSYRRNNQCGRQASIIWIEK